MTDETIVAVFDTSENAVLAVRELEAAGVPASAISQHAANEPATTTEPAREKGFWASLFDGEPEYQYDRAVYDRSLEGGASVVTVKASEPYLTRIMEILERHHPVDLDERATSYGFGGERTTTTDKAIAPAMSLSEPATSREAGDEVIPLAEEQLTVGKRLVNRGTARVRRFVVETPVEEAVTLRSERVSIERRPVTAGTSVPDAAFTDRTIEVTESDEEAVVGKTARVKEEVVVNKAATERVETVRDTVRREDVEIMRDGQATGPSSPTVSPLKRGIG